MRYPFQNDTIAAVFDAADQRDGMMLLRAMIYDVAAELPQTGGIRESLKWGQPSFATQSGSGTPLRIAMQKSGDFRLYAHCQTTVISDYASLFPDAKIDGNRAVIFASVEDIDSDQIRTLIKSALLYHS